MSEAGLYKRMRSMLSKTDFKMYRVESHATCPGIPDIHVVALYGKAFWVELKETRCLATKVPLDEKQVIWHTEYVQQGGLSWILMRRGRELLLWHGMWAKSLADMAGVQQTPAVVRGRDNAETWQKIAAVLGS